MKMSLGSLDSACDWGKEGGGERSVGRTFSEEPPFCDPLLLSELDKRNTVRFNELGLFRESASANLRAATLKSPEIVLPV